MTRPAKTRRTRDEGDARDAAPDDSLPSVGFISLGCAKNLVDSQIMADRLLAGGLRLARSPEEADVVIVNTCAFIEDAREESLEMIDAACRLKEENACRAVIVAGCLSQRYGESLCESLPDVDAFVGLDDLERVADVARRVAAGERGVIDVSAEARRLYEPGAAGVVFTGGPYAYLKIAEGCDHRCAFCAIPDIRGRHRSRPVESIVREAERLLEKGFRELNLISQDTTSYGRDLPDGTASLPALLRALGGLGGRFWIRLLYGYPSHVGDELLEAMASIPQVCAYLDIPVQHSHPDMLRAMRRTATIGAVDTLTARIRAALPGAAIRTTCLVGFPGETEAHVDHLAAFIREHRFDHLGVFAYSPEQGTRGATLPERPPRDVAERRRDRLMKLQRRIAARLGKARVGRDAVVLLERPVPDQPDVWTARSRGQAPEVDGVTFVEGAPRDARAGDFVSVRYVAHGDYDMIAEATPDLG